MKKRTTAVSFRQVDSIDVALTELARQDAQRMLAAALRPETDSSPGDAEAGRSAAAENAKGDLPRAALASRYLSAGTVLISMEDARKLFPARRQRAIESVPAKLRSKHSPINKPLLPAATSGIAAR